jgi:hypothetical protein
VSSRDFGAKGSRLLRGSPNGSAGKNFQVRLGIYVDGNIGKIPEEWRSFSTKHPIGSAHLYPSDLRKLYKIINSKQFEYRDRFMSILVQQPSETAEQFETRKKLVYNSFVTSVTIHTTDNVMLHGNNESFVEPDNVPDNTRSILFSTKSPLLPLGFAPLCSIVLFLDFTLPPPLDFSRLPTLATVNESNFEIQSDNEGWFAASNKALVDLVTMRSIRYVNWLHSAGSYDTLVLLVGIPLVIWGEYHLSSFIETIMTVPQILKTAIYVYSFLLFLNVFRIFFSYSRWVFPKVELETRRRSSPLRHRAAWSAFLVPIGVAIIYDLGKFVFGV